jgi:hypothetical protein
MHKMKSIFFLPPYFVVRKLPTGGIDRSEETDAQGGSATDYLCTCAIAAGIQRTIPLTMGYTVTRMTFA